MSLSCGHQSASGLLSVHLPTCGYKASRKQKGSAVVMALTGRGSGYYQGVRRSSSYQAGLLEVTSEQHLLCPASSIHGWHSFER